MEEKALVSDFNLPESYRVEPECVNHIAACSLSLRLFQILGPYLYHFLFV